MSEIIASLFMLLLLVLSWTALIEKIDQKRRLWVVNYAILVLVEATIAGIMLYTFIGAQ